MDVNQIGAGPMMDLAVRAQEKDVQAQKGESNSEMMKDIRKARLNRQVLADPSLAGELVATEASATYNASGEVIQAVSTDLGDV
ncbi:hypothetical protein [Desulfohalovibrio reitneri]|uniref:hypothetical protein n=1 Tax=Desulfohalovibrio reitneri TaxID=1307759 RepID=UPI001F417B19|nr:hypothetical protein [Desulfohalovibrio reitneri]